MPHGCRGEWRRLRPLAVCVWFVLGLGFLVGTAVGQTPLVLEENMAVLRCAMPDENYRFAGSSNAPGQVSFGDEPVNARFVFKRGGDQAAGAAQFAVEIQEITTRDPDKLIKSGKGVHRHLRPPAADRAGGQAGGSPGDSQLYRPARGRL